MPQLSLTLPTTTCLLKSPTPENVSEIIYGINNLARMLHAADGSGKPGRFCEARNGQRLARPRAQRRKRRRVPLGGPAFGIPASSNDAKPEMSAVTCIPFLRTKT